MPIYEYRCSSCGAELEKLQKISDPPLLECPECGKDALAKQISASSFRLKGSGWYETDFKTGKKKNGVGEGASESAANADPSAAAKPVSAPESTSGATKESSASTGKDSAGDSKDKQGKGKESKKEAVKTSDSTGASTTSKPG